VYERALMPSAHSKLRVTGDPAAPSSEEPTAKSVVRQAAKHSRAVLARCKQRAHPESVSFPSRPLPSVARRRGDEVREKAALLQGFTLLTSP
jgi:hypothetical protein